MPPVVAVLDANLLVPIVACDFLLTGFDHHLIEPIVSSTSLDEIERTLIEDFAHLDPDGLRRRVAEMRTVLEDQTVDTSSVPNLPATINTKDRHVVAAALAAEAAVVVTNDTDLRSEIAGSRLDLESLDGDTFVLRLWDASPGDVSAVIDAMISKRHRRPLSDAQMAAQLRIHFPSMVSAWLDS